MASRSVHPSVPASNPSVPASNPSVSASSNPEASGPAASGSEILEPTAPVLEASDLHSFDELIQPLSDASQYCLRRGEAVVLPTGQRFVTRVLVPTAGAILWDVLTDYGNFYRFLPTVVSSRVLESEGDRHVVEQIDSRTILLASVRTRVCTENIEIPQKRINFRLVDGDMKTMEGHWQLYPVETRESPGVEQTLLVHSAAVDAGSVFFENIVHGLVMESLKANVTAIRDEAERRVILDR